MKEYTWRVGDDLCKTTVPCLPERIALTATGLVTRRESDGAPVLLLCNPHPESWNSWMLPYGSLTLALTEQPAHQTFGELATLIDALHQQQAERYEGQAVGQVREMVGIPGAHLLVVPHLAHYSLKFSKTANVWTCYRFGYHACADGVRAQPTVQSTWLGLDTQSVAALKSSGRLAELPLADNVLALFNDDTVLQMLRTDPHHLPRAKY